MASARADAEAAASLLSPDVERSTARRGVRICRALLAVLVCTAAIAVLVLAAARSMRRRAFLASAIWTTSDVARQTHYLPAPYERQRMTILYATSELEAESYRRPNQSARHVTVLVHLLGPCVR